MLRRLRLQAQEGRDAQRCPAGRGRAGSRRRGPRVTAARPSARVPTVSSAVRLAADGIQRRADGGLVVGLVR
ncbi:MAG: hypothetical protein MZW92_15950 [Comamonadaceae bacterium]|nr:hypothetical protein [Comamonadaceae bacterium]